MSKEPSRQADAGAGGPVGRSIDGQAYRHVLGHYPTGVCAITARSDEGAPIAMIVGTFTAVSIDPPLVGFLPAKTSSSWSSIEKAGRFCANILGADQLAECRQLSGRGCDKYADIEFGMSDGGSPILDKAVAWIDCAIDRVIDAGDHHFVLGRVLSMDVARTADDPMVFSRGRFGGFADVHRQAETAKVAAAAR